MTWDPTRVLRFLQGMLYVVIFPCLAPTHNLFPSHSSQDFKTPAKINFLWALATSKTQMLIHARSYQLGDASVHFVDTATWTMWLQTHLVLCRLVVCDRCKKTPIEKHHHALHTFKQMWTCKFKQSFETSLLSNVHLLQKNPNSFTVKKSHDLCS